MKSMIVLSKQEYNNQYNDSTQYYHIRFSEVICVIIVTVVTSRDHVLVFMIVYINFKSQSRIIYLMSSRHSLNSYLLHSVRPLANESAQGASPSVAPGPHLEDDMSLLAC